VRSREGVKSVSLSLAVLGLAAGAQAAIFALSGSVALMADLIHNLGDAVTAVPLGIAFFLRSFRGEKLAGLAVVLAIFVGKRVSSPPLIADGNHACIDGFVSLGVVASAIVVSLGAEIGDPIIGLAITLVILRITWQSWRTVTTSEPGRMIEPHQH
jgi:divalent metal cation (Fe/Co/Zn/Cd) transporter